jgi:Cu-Zn family superoxide dismutase
MKAPETTKKFTMKAYNFASFLLIVFLLSACNDNIKKATAIISPTNNSTISGEVTFIEKNGIVTMEASIQNASEGNHAIHIHAIGDCSAPDGTSAGGHWNPTNESHGKWEVPPFHRGDIGNIVIGADGEGTITRKTDLWCIGCNDDIKNIIGKSIIIHQGPDDFTSQPAGAAGPRIGCGVIELVK